MSELFDPDIKTIGKHISNSFKENELDKNMVVAKFANAINKVLFNEILDYEGRI